ALVVALGRYAGLAAALCAGVLLTVALPANIAVLGVTRNPFLALWPPTLLALIKALGRDYVLLNTMLLVAASAFYWMATHIASMALALIVLQLLYLLTFTLLGGAL